MTSGEFVDTAIVGGGISGLLTAWRLKQAGVSVRLIEGSDRFGGKVHTVRRDGFVIEAAVNGWLGSRTQVTDLANELGLGSQLIAASAAAKRRYLYHGGSLVPAPLGPLSFAATPLLSRAAKGRVMLEPVAASAPSGDESVASFVRRRLGSEMLDALIDPMVSGVFAGDPEKLSVVSAFPKLVDVERSHGGLFAGLLARMIGNAGVRNAAFGAGRLVSFRDGMSVLVERLVEKVGEVAQAGQSVSQVTSGRDRLEVALGDGKRLGAKRVVLAVPAFAAAPVISEADAMLGESLGQMHNAPVAVVAMGFRRDDIDPLDGFGFLVPHRENQPLLGCLWDSTVYPGRAPEGHVLVRCMLGGARRAELVDEGDETLVEHCLEALRQTRNLRGAPALTQIFRHPRGIPQYHVGHGGRLQDVQHRLESGPFAGRLLLTGNSYRGVSLADCVTDSEGVVAALLSGGSSPSLLDDD